MDELQLMYLPFTKHDPAVKGSVPLNQWPGLPLSNSHMCESASPSHPAHNIYANSRHNLTIRLSFFHIPRKLPTGNPNWLLWAQCENHRLRNGEWESPCLLTRKLWPQSPAYARCLVTVLELDVASLVGLCPPLASDTYLAKYACCHHAAT